MKVTIEEFVKDRHDDFCTEHNVGAVLFDQGFINSVYRETALNLNCEDGFHPVLAVPRGQSAEHRQGFFV